MNVKMQRKCMKLEIKMHEIKMKNAWNWNEKWRNETNYKAEGSKKILKNHCLILTCIDFDLSLVSALIIEFKF